MTSANFSLSQARGIVRDLFTPNPLLYWADFLATIVCGHLAFSATRRLPELLSRFQIELQPAWVCLLAQGLCFVASCLLYFRAVNFIHELVHLPERRFLGFRGAWNLLCGIPFLLPSFTYHTHLDHHRRRMFGTRDDGEYIPLSHLSPWWLLVYLSQCCWAPLVAVVRFAVVTPLTWVSSGFRDFVHRRMSSLVMDPRYLRPLPTPADLRTIRLQELLCCLWCWALVLAGPRIMPPNWLPGFLLQAYLTSVVLIFLNSLRTLAAHRFWSDGGEKTFVEQLLDSVDIAGSAPWEWLLNPVGLRYHATHHLFPSLPYHNLRAAHLRLHAELPADSPYRQTAERSLFTALWGLWRRSWQRKGEGTSAPGADSHHGPHPLVRPAAQQKNSRRSLSA